ncbi:MAG TPA: hypothetical protein VNP96_10950 [Solirubrobacterales bacterium]|nr:hypothetical protein [Solirubrobacterales bacterium]
MSQPSECPKCRRIFVIGADRLSGPRRCEVCGTLLVVTGREKEAEVRDRLYGPRVSLNSVTRVVTPR